MMTRTLKKLSAVILALATVFILSLPSLAHAADTGGVDHFQLTVTENKDSRSGTEIADLTIKNISGKTGSNVTFEADLPEVFHDKDMKKVTFNVGTLKAGEFKTYQVSRKADGTINTDPLPTTGTTKPTNGLPTTGEVVTPLLFISGVLLFVGTIIIGFKHYQGGKNLLIILLLVVGLGSTATVNAAEKNYRHRDEVKNHEVELAGATHIFHLAAEGDFDGGSGDKGEQGVADNFTITYYINGDKVTNLDPDSYIAGVQTTYLPTLTEGFLNFSGWYENEACSGNVITSLAKDATGDKVFYCKATPKTYQVTFNSDGGDVIPTTTLNHGQLISEPSEPTKDDAITPLDAPSHDFNFEGWYTDEALTTAFDFQTPITQDMTLYAKWRLPMAESVLVDFTDDVLGNQRDRVWFANSWWRILDDDMDNDATNGLQALVIKLDDIGNSKFFEDPSRHMLFFDGTTSDGDPADGSNGYEDSRLASIGGIGKFIDDWYDVNVKGTNAEPLVQSVNLNNPSFDIFGAGITFDGNDTLARYQWNSWYQDTRFATTLDNTVSGSQQAFALSYGDIYGHLGVATSEWSSPLLDFSNCTRDFLWLRSPGGSYNGAGFVFKTAFRDRQNVNYGYPVHPAISIKIK